MKKRIGSILKGCEVRELGAIAKWMLGGAALLTIAMPVGIGLLTPQLRAQSLFTTPYTGPGFEVASIKPSEPNQRGTGIPPPEGGRYRAINVTVRSLLGYAYHAQFSARILGGPAWIDSDRFDINAKAETAVPEAKIRPMVLKLLEDRFGLKFHHEQRLMPAYFMTVAKGGPKFQVSSVCKHESEDKFPCGGFRVSKRRYIAGQQVSAEDLAEVLEVLMGEPVIDKTGINGLFDVKLEWTPDERQLPGRDLNTPPANPDGPSIFVAMQEQLGLKLERQKAAVDVVVVDAASKPSAN